MTAMRKLRKTPEGLWRLAHPRMAQQYRLNVGVIIEEPMVDIRMQSQGAGRPARAGAVLGQLEEYFIEQLTPGDTLRLRAAKCCASKACAKTAAYVTKTNDTEAQVPSYQGRQVSALDIPGPARARDGVEARDVEAAARSRAANGCASRNGARVHSATGPVAGGDLSARLAPYLVCYPFEGRLAHQTLGMLLTRRLERLRMRPLGFVRQRICAGGLGAARHGRRRHGQAVRRGHAGRRSRRLAGRIQRSTSAPSAIARSSPG